MFSEPEKLIAARRLMRKASNLITFSSTVTIVIGQIWDAKIAKAETDNGQSAFDFAEKFLAECEIEKELREKGN
jgi:hypothetical protein